MHALLIILLVLLVFGALPGWLYSANMGPVPSGALGVIVILLVALALLGHL